MLRRASLGTVYLLKRTELAVRSCVEVALAGFDLTPSQFLLLLLLDYEGLQSAAKLARALGVRPQSITEIIAPLKTKKLIKRQASKEHRRVLEISLSAAGKKRLDEAIAVAAQLESELLAGLDRQELVALDRALEKLMASAERHECHPNVRRLVAEEHMRAQVARSWATSASRERRRRRASSSRAA